MTLREFFTVDWSLMPLGYWAGVAAVMGLFLGSFLYLCIDRMCRHESVVIPASHCVSCGRTLRIYELIPVVSWVLLGGRCRTCHAPIGIWSPVTEIVTALVFAAVVWVKGPGTEAIALCAVSAVYIVLSGVDLKISELPDVITLPFAPVSFLLAVLVFHVSPAMSLVAGFGCAGVFWGLSWLFKRRRGIEGLGFGDTKLMLSIGFLAGVKLIALAVVLASFAALIAFGVIALVHGQKGIERLRLPFGPFLCLGSWLCLMWGDALWSAWLSFIL